jgi:signal transduction histidine kinase
MPKKSWIFLALTFVPLLLGIVGSILAQGFWNPIPVLVFKMDVGVVAFIAGLAITLLLLAIWLGVATSTNKASRLSKDERIRAGQNAKRAQERLSSLLGDLRKLADLEERQIERRQVDISELLHDVVDAARSIPVYEGRHVNLFITKVPSPFPCVIGDRDLLVLAMYNLVQNALKFTSEDEPVEVRALEDGRSVYVEVADSGAGIPSEDLPKIFEELYRGSNARGIEGSGLGLALVHRIVTLHGGQIIVRSRQGDSHGTVFTIRLPEGR